MAKRCSILNLKSLKGLAGAIQLAHEIANAIGIRDDGDGNDCAPSDGFIMSHQTIAGLQDKVLRKPTWSRCSIQQGQQILRSNTDCFATVNSMVEGTAMSLYQDRDKYPFGTELNKVCEIAHKGSEAVLDADDLVDCSSLQCRSKSGSVTGYGYSLPYYSSCSKLDKIAHCENNECYVQEKIFQAIT